MDSRNGFKLYNESESLFSWHDTLEDAIARQRFEAQLYGRQFQIAAVSDAEWSAFAPKLEGAQ